MELSAAFSMILFGAAVWENMDHGKTILSEKLEFPFEYRLVEKHSTDWICKSQEPVYFTIKGIQKNTGRCCAI